MPPRRHNKQLTVTNPYPKVSPSAPDLPTKEELQRMFAVKPQMLKGSGLPGEGVMMQTLSAPFIVDVQVPDHVDPGPGPPAGATTSPAPSIGPKAQKNINENLPIGPQPGPSKPDWWHMPPQFPVRYAPNGVMILEEPVNTRARRQIDLARSFGAYYR
ncbi:hypothetical protein HGRIS_014059 [Hohenbuehelia grisea]|uniref:Uncharacterized protein n=1 Tax=Hohenbuehelia grisea TaxID=104357 RepID=A0ABR3JS97_9AGAR